MEKFWNFIHYFVYKSFYKIYLLSNKINPLVAPFQLPNGEDNFKELNESYKRTDFGVCITIAGGFMEVILMLLFWGSGSSKI